MGGYRYLTGIQNIEGSDFSDVLIGESGVNIFDGNDGDDTIQGMDGDDI